MGGISVIFLMGIFSVWVFVFIAIFATIVIFAVINYIFESISISCIGNKMNCSFKFISWIPFYNKFLLGKIGGNKIIGGILGILNLFIVLFGIYFFVNTKTNYIIVCIFILCLLLSFILDTILSYKIYSKAVNKYSSLLTVLNILSLGILRPIILFVIRNKVSCEV
ncbi:putative uncharacterized protein [Clostridium sp. CAG:921]|nr:putative uncharacterized protein [Clostridium sp. CAG:921]